MFTSRWSTGPRVGVLVEDRYLAQAQPAGLVARLQQRGVEVVVHVADRLPTDLGHPTMVGEVDFVVARGRSPRLLSLLRTLETNGVAVLHDAAAIAAVVDKAAMSAALWRAGIPTPRTWLATVAELQTLADVPFPLLLKPLYGDNARGIEVVTDVADLAGLAWPEPVALAQPFHRGDGHDIKLYVAGGGVWAVRRPSPIDVDGSVRADPDPGHEVPVTDEMVRIASACAEVFGLSLFGVDCVEVDGELMVVEVNEYPNYRGLACDADDFLCEVVLDAMAATAPQVPAPRTEPSVGARSALAVAR